MHLIMERIFEYGFLWVGPENSLYKTDDPPSPKTSFEENISKGLSVMLSIMMATNEQVKGSPFYPEFRTFWPRPGFDTQTQPR
jgi:hypothetical protein